MPVGTWGAVNRVQLGPGQWVARARFRDYDGVTRIVERGGASGQKAEKALKEALRDRARLPAEDLTPETRLSRVAEEWTKELDRRDVSDGTKDLYRRNLKHIIRGMGGLQMREVTVPAVDRFLEALMVNSGPETARLCRVVLRGICSLAVRKGAMPLNPVRDAVAIPRKAVEPRTLDVAEVVRARAQLAEWDARLTNGGALRRTDIADPVDMILGTGIRTGEVFALRWEEDVHLVDIPYIEVTGTAKEITGKGSTGRGTRRPRCPTGVCCCPRSSSTRSTPARATVSTCSRRSRAPSAARTTSARSGGSSGRRTGMRSG